MKSTNETYDSIADQYLERWQDRSPIQIHAKRFIDMVRAYQLTDYPILDVGCGPGFDAAGFRDMYLSLKRGQGQGWEFGDYDRSRFFTYWQASAIDACIRSAGFQIVDGWQGPGVSDEWLIRFARKNAGQNLLKLNDQENL